MRHALPSVHAVLDRDVQAAGPVHALDGPADAMDRGEEVGCFFGRQARDARDGAARADQDVAGEEGLDVHEGEGEGRAMEDLRKKDDYVSGVR